jgi:hypothetical protein
MAEWHFSEQWISPEQSVLIRLIPTWAGELWFKARSNVMKFQATINQ